MSAPVLGLRDLLGNWPADGTSAIVTDERRLTYRALHKGVAACEARLRMTIRPGDIVGLCIPNGIELVLLMLALNSLRATIFLAHHQLSDGELAALIEHEGATAVLCERERADLGWQTSILPCLPDRVVLHVGQERLKPRQKPADSAVHLYTSGTDGRLKGVIRSERSLVREGRAIATTLGLTRITRVLCPVPLCHAYGLGMGLLGMLASGGTLVLSNPPTARLLRRCAVRHRPDIVIAVPVLYDLWSRGPRQELPPELLRVCVSSGAPLPPSVAEAFEHTWGRRIARQYGMSECGPIAIDLACSTEPTCVGEPYPGVRVRIEPAPATGREIGELVAISPYVGSGYVGGLERGLAVNPFAETGLRTGDWGYVDVSGRIYLVSRKTAHINVHGQKVDPAEVEAVIAGHPSVREVVVLGVERRDQDEWVVAFVVTEPTVPTGELELLCQRNLAPYKRPQRIIVVAAIPKTRTGKPWRAALLQWLRDGVPTKPNEAELISTHISSDPKLPHARMVRDSKPRDRGLPGL